MAENRLCCTSTDDSIPYQLPPMTEKSWLLRMHDSWSRALVVFITSRRKRTSPPRLLQYPPRFFSCCFTFENWVCLVERFSEQTSWLGKLRDLLVGNNVSQPHRDNLFLISAPSLSIRYVGCGAYFLQVLTLDRNRFERI